eukprot:8457127-Pyramimonas_sp.AAC.1
MNANDAASKLRAIAAQKSHTRQPFNAAYPRAAGTIERVLQGSITSSPGPYDRQLRDLEGELVYLPKLGLTAWFIWAFLNALFVMFIISFQEKAPPPVLKPIFPLTNIEMVELLQGAMSIQGFAVPSWKEADVHKPELIQKVLLAQEDLSVEGQNFTTHFRHPNNYVQYKVSRDKCNFTRRELTEGDFFTYKFYASTPMWEKSYPDSRNSYCQALTSNPCLSVPAHLCSQ